MLHELRSRVTSAATPPRLLRDMSEPLEIPLYGKDLRCSVEIWKNRSTLVTAYYPIRRNRVLEELLDAGGVPLEALCCAARGYVGLAACLLYLRLIVRFFIIIVSKRTERTSTARH